MLLPFPRLLCVFAGLAATSFAATTTVNSIAALQAQINSAAAGDVIIVENGTYTTTAAITISRSGAAGSPIQIKAATIGGVEIRGSHGFQFNSPASYIEVEGFQFTHANSINIPSGTRHIRLTRNVIQLAIPSGTDRSYINISGDDIRIDRNELRNKTTLGNMLDVTGSGSQVARRLWVHHNHFHDFTSPGGNGAETIRLGLSGLSMSNGDAIVEHNLFERCRGENELISNKSGRNTYRYNTISDSPGAQLTLRHGNDCIAYGNYFRNTDGLRVYGDRHLIHSNYFEGNTKGIDMGNGDGEVATGSELTVHDRPDNCVVVFNTFVNNTVHYQMGGRTGGLGALNVTIANNIMYGAGNAASVSSTAPHTATWTGNMVWDVTTVGNLPAPGFTQEDPRLARDANGIYHLQAGSPAIDRAEGSFAGVTFDMDGQARPDAAKDKGADEFLGSAATARPLTPADVGPLSGLVQDLAAPMASHASGTYAREQYVALTSSTSNAAIRYTTDGSTPTSNHGAIYTGILTISATTTLKAVATFAGSPDSPVLTREFVIDSGAPASGRLANLSTRGMIQPNSALTPGFIVAGSGEKTLLVRAIGPTLASFGLPTALGDSKLELIPAGASAPMAANDDWNRDGSEPALASTMAAVGAFPLAGDAKDAAILRRLASGQYSVRITPAGIATSGVALAEIYDADAAPFTTRLINVSTLGFVGTSDNVLTAGFVIVGSQPKQLLIRAVGPGLASFGVGGLLADPELSVVPLGSATPVAANNDWGTGTAATALAGVFSKVGAFTLTSGSRDAAIVVQLPPGGYSVVVSGVGSTTGNAIVEIYDLEP